MTQARATSSTAKRQRTCVACGAKLPKSSLVRVVRSPEGAIALDTTGRAPGRGAYVCSAECLLKACEARMLSRALKTKVSEEDYERVAADARLRIDRKSEE